MQNVEQITPTDTDKSTNFNEQKAVRAKKLCDKEEGSQLHSWEAVAQGVNYVESATYLFANAILFALCICPLLISIFDYASVTPYLIKSDTP